MSLNKEGFKMDPKLAETMKRIKAEHPSPVVDVADETEVSKQIVTTPRQEKKKRIDPDAMAHDLYHRVRQTDP